MGFSDNGKPKPEALWRQDFCAWVVGFFPLFSHERRGGKAKHLGNEVFS